MARLPFSRKERLRLRREQSDRGADLDHLEALYAVLVANRRQRTVDLI